VESAGRGIPLADVVLLPPADGRMEVWAAGRYDAERPDLSFTATPERLVTDGEAIGACGHWTFDVAQPELAVVLNAAGEIVGYTVCNDVGSHDIEGENALNPWQATLVERSCALAPGIRPAWLVPDPHQLAVRVCQTRGSRVVWAQEASTASLRRRIPDLASRLFREQRFPDGAVLSTGTGLVPGRDDGLAPGDLVVIEIAGVGALINPVGRRDVSPSRR